MMEVDGRPERPALEVTIETAIDDEHAEGFYRLYLDAFEPLRTRAAARQVLHRDEFLDDMRDPRVFKYVGWSSGRPIALATMTRHLETVPWISPEYFRARYPEHAARRAIYYLGFTLVHPTNDTPRALEQMIAAGVGRLVQARAVCAFDVCAYNDVGRQFTARVTETLHRLADVTVDRLDSQRYYCATFG
ncbi:MAG TPA: hypothetical protein VIT41_16460 [Microlunatus sp.]